MATAKKSTWDSLIPSTSALTSAVDTSRALITPTGPGSSKFPTGPPIPTGQGTGPTLPGKAFPQGPPIPQHPATVPSGPSITDALWTKPWGDSTPNTKGYATPQWTPTAGSWGPVPSGYDTAKWNDPNYWDPKYGEGRIYQAGQNAGESFDQIIADLKKAYPGITYSGSGDVINFPGIGPVDIARDFGGENGIHWGDLSAETSQPQAGSGIQGLDLNSILSSFGAKPATPGPSAMSDPFASIGGGVQTADGGWIPRGMASPEQIAASEAQATPAASVGAMGASPSQPLAGSPTQPGQAPAQAGTPASVDINQILSQILSHNGAMPVGSPSGLDMNAVNPRIEAARTKMEQGRKSQVDTLLAELSDRGIMDGGPMTTGFGQIEQNLADTYGADVQNIMGSEAASADSRFQDALALATGLKSSGASNAIAKQNADTGQYSAETTRQLGQGTLANQSGQLALDKLLGQGNLDLQAGRLNLDQILGQGNLALGNATLGANYNLGQGRLGLDQQLGQGTLDNDTLNQILTLLKLKQGGADTTTGGSV